MSESLNQCLETSRVEAVVQTYPPEMREPVLWLAGFILHECGRNFEVLEAKVKKLGFPTTASTFSKIIRGHWDTTAEGEPTAPCLQLKTFQKIVRDLRNAARLSTLAGELPFVKTTTAQDIYNYIDERRAPGRINKFGLIIGPTGAQKTASFRHYAMENNHGQVVWQESPARPRLSSFIADLANCYGASRYAGLVSKEITIYEALSEHRTIILDNVQRLYRAEQGGRQDIFGFVQKLQDESRCTIIFSVTIDFLRTLTSGVDKGYFEQFVGRCGGPTEYLELPPYTPPADVLLFAQAFGLQDAEAHQAYLDKICRELGRVRILLGCLQKAKMLADRRKQPLTIKHLKQVRNEE